MNPNTGGPASEKTLLDEFAGRALTGYRSQATGNDFNLASECYDDAEAMLAEKARRETQPTERISIGSDDKRKAFDAFKLLENIDHPEFSAVRLAIAKLTSRFEVGNGEDVQESKTTDDSGKVAKLEALNRELAGELEKFTKAVELFIGDSPELRSARAILAKTKEVA